MAARRGARPTAVVAPGWKVSYTLSGRHRAVRKFRTEAEAREFYTALFRRRNPPAEQAIERDVSAT